MPVTSTPVWQAAQAGVLGQASLTAGSAQVNQLLGTHADTVLYEGAQVVAPYGAGVSAWALQMSTLDIDQPFPMSGTVLGRVQIPLLAVGNGADLLVSLCADNAGNPGTVLQQTWIPASWISQLSAVSAPSTPAGVAPTTQLTGNPLAVAQFNTLTVGPYTLFNYAVPATSGSNIIQPNSVASGNYLVGLGGNNQSTSAIVANVSIIPVSGGNATQVFSSPIPQPSMPLPNSQGLAFATSDTLVMAGGIQSVGYVTTVYTASWDPTTGAIGTWSVQQPLPVALGATGAAASGETVYVVGGSTNSATQVNTVYYATINNGQITAWNTGPNLPLALNSIVVVVCNGFLFAIGGEASGIPSPTIFYAAINADGSLGQWITGPPFQYGSILSSGSNAVAQSPQGIIINGGFTTPGAYILGVTANGPAPAWYTQNDLNLVASAEWIMVAGNGADYELATADPAFGHLRQAQVHPTPFISVPLPATGLTNGATYHILMQQQGGDAADYLCTHLDTNVYTGNPTALTSNQNAYTWTAQAAGQAVPIQIWDQTVTGTALHTWADNGARVSTLVYATTPDQRLLGLCEATRIGVGLNANQGFETSTAHWGISAAQGTIARSSAQAKEGLFSLRITPSGTASQVWAQSENLHCLPGQSVTASAWMWFTNAVTTNASMTVFWYTAAGTFISSSSNNVSVAAATWTQLTNTFTAPSGAYKWSLNPTLSGTPAAGQVWYVDNAFGVYTYTGVQQSSVIEVPYGGTWPSVQTQFGLGTTVLA